MKLPLRNPENRATYRVQIDEAQATLWVGLKSGPTKAILEDLSSRGCGFLLQTDEAKGLEEGSDLVLRMKVGGPKAPQLFIRAEVRSTRTLDGLVQFGAVFKDPQRLYQQLNEPQWRFFNRRGAFRVAPANHRGDPL
ncbi:MAG: PilZ domain-containing protein, partial [Planctomycetota bacterium]